MDVQFEWDLAKEAINVQKHDVNFYLASQVFDDHKRVIFMDEKHGHYERRMFCVGLVNKRVLTVRFVLRAERIRIIGAGYWRKGVRLYEKKNKIN